MKTKLLGYSASTVWKHIAAITFWAITVLKHTTSLCRETYLFPSLLNAPSLYGCIVMGLLLLHSVVNVLISGQVLLKLVQSALSFLAYLAKIYLAKIKVDNWFLYCRRHHHWNKLQVNKLSSAQTNLRGGLGLGSPWKFGCIRTSDLGASKGGGGWL